MCATNPILSIFMLAEHKQLMFQKKSFLFFLGGGGEGGVTSYFAHVGFFTIENEDHSSMAQLSTVQFFR